MPSYDYRCRACGEKQTHRLPMDRVGRAEPAHCGQPMKRLFTVPMLKADGAYSYREGDR